jgi:hypothetical protein
VLLVDAAARQAASVGHGRPEWAEQQSGAQMKRRRVREEECEIDAAVHVPPRPPPPQRHRMDWMLPPDAVHSESSAGKQESQGPSSEEASDASSGATAKSPAKTPRAFAPAKQEQIDQQLRHLQRLHAEGKIDYWEFGKKRKQLLQGNILSDVPRDAEDSLPSPQDTHPDSKAAQRAHREGRQAQCQSLLQPFRGVHVLRHTPAFSVHADVPLADLIDDDDDDNDSALDVPPEGGAENDASSGSQKCDSVKHNGHAAAQGCGQGAHSTTYNGELPSSHAHGGATVQDKKHHDKNHHDQGGDSKSEQEWKQQQRWHSRIRRWKI